MTQESRAPGTAPGDLTIEEQVVAKICGGAAREVDGVHAMGTGRLAERVTGVAATVRGEDFKKGVRVEVGKKEVASISGSPSNTALTYRRSYRRLAKRSPYEFMR